MAKNIDFMGATFPDVPSIRLPQHGGGLVSFDDTTDATATADKILQGYTAYANGQKLVGTASGGITPSGTYSITSNGIYDIVSFASVDVNVSGGGGSEIVDAIFMKTISGIVSGSATQMPSSIFANCSFITGANYPNVITIPESAFTSCKTLASISFPNATWVQAHAFKYCSSLSVVNLPNVTSMYGSAFMLCSGLTEVNIPKLTSVDVNTFSGCKELKSVDFPMLKSRIASKAFCGCSALSVAKLGNTAHFFGSYQFSGCIKLKEVYLFSTSVAILSSSNAFDMTPIKLSNYGGWGSIYVPASLVDSYKSANNWSYFSDRITAIEE